MYILFLYFPLIHFWPAHAAVAMQMFPVWDKKKAWDWKVVSSIPSWVRPKTVKMVSAVPMLGPQCSGLELVGWIGQWFPGAVPLLPTAPSVDDGSNTEDKFCILQLQNRSLYQYQIGGILHHYSNSIVKKDGKQGNKNNSCCLRRLKTKQDIYSFWTVGFTSIYILTIHFNK